MKLIPTLALTVILAAISTTSLAQVAPAAGRAGGRGAAGAVRGTAAREAVLDRIDQREANQARRIQAGIKQGQLTADEITKLQSLETNIATLETSLKSDAKLTKPELQQIRQALNAASLQIWAERHDTEGNQKPARVLGKDVFAQDQLTAKLESPDLTKAQAREFLQDFRKLINLKHRLATETLTPEQRTKLQSEYDTLLNQYFLLKP